MKDGLVRDESGVVRCWWGSSSADYQAYHDDEWGQPVDSEARLFEKLCLEGFQSGLSWLTILRKRDNFRRAFAGFDYRKVAGFNQRSVTRLLGDASIVRHRGKIEAAINNAKVALALVDQYGSLAAFLWRYEPAPSDRPKVVDKAALTGLSKTAASAAMSGDLKSAGCRFVGPTTCYALMQAMGMVNDHLEGCHARPAVERARKRFKRPKVVA